MNAPRPRALGVAFAGGAFVALAYAAHRVAYFTADLQLARVIQRIDAPWLVRPFEALNAIGFPPQVGLLYGGIVVALFVTGRRREAVTGVFASGGAAVLNFVVKAIVDRPRPSAALVRVMHHAPGGGFPAGHVLNATAFLGLLCWLAYARMAPSPRRTAAIVTLLAVIATMGVARIWAGEHWPSDVLGGYLLGGLWLAASIALYRRLERRARQRFPTPARLRHATIVAACAAGLATARTAEAYRPFDYSDADVAAPATVEFEFAPAEYIALGSDHAARVPTLDVAIGVGGGFELGFEGTNLVALGRTTATPRSYLTETGVGIAKLVRKGELQDARGPSVTAEIETQFPDRFQTHLGAEATLVVSDIEVPGVLHVGARYTRTPEGDDAAGGGILVEAQDSHGWRPVAQFTLEAQRGAPPVQALLAGAIYEVKEGLSLDGGVQVGCSGGQRWTEVRAGVTWQVGPEGTKGLRRLVKFHLRRRH